MKVIIERPLGVDVALADLAALQHTERCEVVHRLLAHAEVLGSLTGCIS